MKLILTFIFSFFSILIFSQLILPRDELKKNYPNLHIKKSTNSIEFYSDSDFQKNVGFTLSTTSLGYWNSIPDTFKLNDSLLVVFINPFPNVQLKEISQMKSTVKSSAIGYKGYLFSCDVDGNSENECIGSDELGRTMCLYFESPQSVFQIKYFLDGEIVECKSFDNTVFFPSHFFSKGYLDSLFLLFNRFTDN